MSSPLALEDDGPLCSIPLLMFIIWNSAILGSIDAAPGSGQKVDPLVLLTQSAGPSGLLIQAHLPSQACTLWQLSLMINHADPYCKLLETSYSA